MGKEVFEKRELMKLRQHKSEEVKEDWRLPNEDLYNFRH
jgi:hypothetical protein